MTDVIISRRAALVGAVAAPIVASTALSSTPAAAKADMKGVAIAPYARFKVGSFEVTTLLAGTRVVGEPQKTFGMNVDADTFAAASKENFIPADQTRFYFTPTVVNTGNELVLFDTGLGAEPMIAALAGAGYTAEQIDIVVLTHMHPDHIGGMMNNGSPTYPNARYVTGSTEYDFWKKAGPDNRIGGMMAKLVTPLAEKMSFLAPGGSVVSGVTAVDASGHTPGHMAYMLESDGQQVLITADSANHFVWSLAYPDWEVRFDMDKAAAAATRKKLFGMLASDRIGFIGFHMPFPSLGFVEARGSGFRYVPASYQFAL